MRAALLPLSHGLVDALDRGEAIDSQRSWLFLAGAAAALGFVIATVVAQQGHLIELQGTKLPAIASVLVVGVALAVVATKTAVPLNVRSCAGSASAGLIAAIAVVGVPLGLILLPAAALIGAGAAVMFEGATSRMRWASIACFAIAVVVSLYGVFR